VHKTKQRPNTGTKKCDCKIKVVAKKALDRMARELKVTEDTHNHEPSRAPTAYPAHRIASLDSRVRAEIINYWKRGMQNAQILTNLRMLYPEIQLLSSNISNITQAKRVNMLAGKTPIQWLLDVCSKPRLLITVLVCSDVGDFCVDLTSVELI
jgi:hypothetical protein